MRALKGLRLPVEVKGKNKIKAEELGRTCQMRSSKRDHSLYVVLRSSIERASEQGFLIVHIPPPNQDRRRHVQAPLPI